MFLCILGGAKVINVSVSAFCKCMQAPLSIALKGLPFRRGGSRQLHIKSLTEKCGSVFIWKCTGLQRHAIAFLGASSSTYHLDANTISRK